MLGKWDKDGLHTPREKVYHWQLVDCGTESERVICEKCGNSISRAVYGQRHSLPLICVKCKTKMQGFVWG